MTSSFSMEEREYKESVKLSYSLVPRRVVVDEVLCSRYSEGEKPVSWDKRIEGIERIKTKQGEEIALFSGGGQSTPSRGWELLLMKKQEVLCSDDNRQENQTIYAFRWTLYGIQKSTT